MSGYSGTRAARSGSGDVCRYRVGALVAEHRDMVSAMWAAIDAHGEAQRTHVARLEKLVGDIAYGLTTGMPPTAFMLRVETLIGDYKASGLSTRGGGVGWCSPGGGRPAEVDGLRGPASTAGGVR